MTKLLVIAGEASGDLHGGNVILELKKLNPELEVVGTGGKVLESAGARLFYRVEQMAVIGFWEPLKRFRYLKGVFDDMVRKLDEEKPDAVLLVDYPGGNLRYAEEVKKRGIKVIYYIAPQVWAWKLKRIEKIRKFVDELIVLFPFEVDFFKKHGLETHCFGHPLLEKVKPTSKKQETYEKWGLDPNKKTICCLPGSRYNEIKKHLPLLFDTIDLLNQRRPNFQFVFPLASTVNREMFSEFIESCKAEVHLAENDTYNVVAHSDFALVASGTATLETAILQTPLIIFYKSSLTTYLIGKYILRIKAIGLPNVVVGDMVVQEDPHFSSPEKMSKAILRYLDYPELYQGLKKNLAKVKEELGQRASYKNTAKFINSIL